MEFGASLGLPAGKVQQGCVSMCVSREGLAMRMQEKGHWWALIACDGVSSEDESLGFTGH